MYFITVVQKLDFWRMFTAETLIIEMFSIPYHLKHFIIFVKRQYSYLENRINRTIRTIIWFLINLLKCYLYNDRGDCMYWPSFDRYGLSLDIIQWFIHRITVEFPHTDNIYVTAAAAPSIPACHTHSVSFNSRTLLIILKASLHATICCTFYRTLKTDKITYILLSVYTFCLLLSFPSQFQLYFPSVQYFRFIF